VSLNALAELLIGAKKGGQFAVRAFPSERKKIDIGDFYSDYRLLTKKLGWKPKVSLPSALEKTLAYYRKELPNYL